CAVDSRVTRVAWLNRSTILYTGNDKWSIDPRVVLIANTKSSYSIEIQNVDIYDEGPYTCSVQTDNHPKTSRVHLIVQGKPVCSSDVAVILVADDGPEVWGLLSEPRKGMKVENRETYSRVTFFNVSEQDYGNYTCVAMNRLGHSNASVIL
ncbi:hypothetical protein AB205_0113260, partial [Aquarana catesbeiana]